MFEELFSVPHVIERYHAAALVEDRLRYLQHLKDTGSGRRTLRDNAINQLSLVRLLDLKDGDRVSVREVELAAAKWSQPGGRRWKRAASSKSKSRFTHHALQWLRFLGALDEPDNVRHPYGDEIAVYQQWMREERGLSEQTIRTQLFNVKIFFDWLAVSETPLASVKVTDIDSAIAARHAQGTCNRRTIHDYARHLKSFIRFAEDRSWCRPGMAKGIRPLRMYPDETMPKGISRTNVLRLLETTEGNRPVDKRDRAILMLLIAYGLRAGEVSALRLDDLDWEKETLTVRRSKSGRTNLYPLSRGVGQATLRYILEVRPRRPERTLFFTLVAPIRPVTPGALWEIVSKRLGSLGIVTGPRGPHALRHAAAQHLLDQGMSMKVIGDFLGHRDPDSTATYAKVNLSALREVADFDLEGLA